MDRTRYQLWYVVAACMLLGMFSGVALADHDIELVPVGTYETGVFDDGAAEITAYDPASKRLFVVNAATQSIDVLDVSDPSNMSLLFSIDVSPYGNNANSVDSYDGLVAAAIENDDKQAPGVVAFFDADGNFLKQVTVGALPDMLTFTEDGQYVLVANEGEPNDDYDVDPEGSVSVIGLKYGVENAGVRTADFSKFNNKHLDKSIRIFGPGASVAQDLEPEFIAVAGKYAYVVCQENNALAIVDYTKPKVVALKGLGFKNHYKRGNALDASNRDDAINIKNWPVYGMYQPDAIASYSVGGKYYLVSANEGDARDYDGYSEEERIKDLDLDPEVFPNAEDLQEDENLGRLNSTTANGDADGDGYFEKLFAYGARSFSIWDAYGNQVFDSGDQFERITATLLPDDFNSTNDENGSFDNRSDDKGPEPEGVAIGKVGNRHYAFIGLERVGGIMVYDISKPKRPKFVQYINTRDFDGDAEAGTAGDLAPEGLLFIPKYDSPTNKPLLVVSYEVSGTVTVFEINDGGYGAKFAGNGNNLETTVPQETQLHQNFPNPFNPTTGISFQLAQSEDVTLSIYNTLGQEVRTLVREDLREGYHTVEWDGKDSFGRPVSSGIYFYRLAAGAHISVRQMQLQR